MSHRSTVACCALLVVALVGCQSAETPAESTAQGSTAQGSTAPDTEQAEDPGLTYEGVDVSHFQGSIDWPEVHGAGKVFAFVKATEGTDHPDPNFADNWEGARSAGLVRGAYHFFHTQSDPVEQAKAFEAVVTLEAGDLAPVLDVEVTDGVDTETLQDDVRHWLETIEAAYGITPILYSSKNFIDAHLSSGFSRYPLWIADYTDTAPEPPGDWNHWTFWQYSQGLTVAGIEGGVDGNRFRGTAEQWQALRIQAAPAAP